MQWAEHPVHARVRPFSALLQEVSDGHTDVPRDFPQENGRNVATLMKGHRRSPAVVVPELLMAAFLPRLAKPKALQDGDHFRWL